MMYLYNLEKGHAWKLHARNYHYTSCNATCA